MSRAVLGFFPSSTAAERAMERFRAVGYGEEDLQMTQVHRYPGDGTDRLQNPTQGRFNGLGELALGAEVDPTRNVGPLLAADPSASGFSATDELPGQAGFMVTVVVDSDEAAEGAARIIEEAGGLV